MRRMAICAMAIACLLSLCMPAFSDPGDSGYDDIYVEVSQSYLRPDVNDNVTVTVGLLDHGVRKNVSGVIISFKIQSNSRLVTLDEGIIMTGEDGTASTTLRLNMDNYRASDPALPAPVQVAAFTAYSAAGKNVFIVDTGTISGYVVDDSKNVILGAKITAYGPDGKEAKYLDGPFHSSNGTDAPMGWYSMEHVPLDMGTYRVIVEKAGFVGMNMVNVSHEERRIDLTLPGYIDKIPTPTTNYNNTTTTLEPTPTEDAPAKPGTMTSTIILIIVIISLSYVGLKIYRRYF